MKRNKAIAPIISIFILFALGVCVYWPSLRAPFQFDDYMTIVEDSAIKDLRSIFVIWMTDPSRFLTHLSFAVNYFFGGLKPEGYHAVNLLLHFAVAGLVYLFLKEIFQRGLKENRTLKDAKAMAFFGAAIFLVHPLQTSAVTYVSQRSTLLAGACYLLALLLYVRFRQEKKLIFYIFSVAVAFVGLFTKPIIITLPFAIILLEIFFLDFSFKRDKKIILAFLPFVFMIVAVPSLLMLWKYKSWDLTRLLDVTRETNSISRGDYLLTQFNVLVTYLRLLVFPVHQNLDYDYPIARSFFSFPTFFSFCILFGILILAMQIYKKQKLIAFGISWFFLTLSLESSFFPIADVIFEHRLYLPMIGAIIVCAVLLFRFISLRRWQIAAALILISILSVLSYQRNIVWSDRLGFLEDIVRKSPGKARVHNNLAVVYHEKGFLEKAQQEYEKAIALDNHYAHPHNNLGNIYFEKGDIDRAIAELNLAIEIKPNYDGPHYNLGNVHRQKGDSKAAEESYRKALEINPTFAPAYAGLGRVHLEKNDLSKAKFYFYEAIRFNPDFAFAFYSLGDIYVSEEKYEMAYDAYKSAAKRDDKMASAHNNMGNIADMLGRYDEAIDCYEKAIAVDVQFANAYFNLANTLNKIGQINEAQKVLAAAIKLYENQNNKKMLDSAQRRLQNYNSQ
ncbi:MAG: tetratricopeptide repeat protein [Candidatus Omnitrophota bacterium]